MSAQAKKPPTWTHTDTDGAAQMARALAVRSFRTNADGSVMSTTERVRVVRALAIATQFAVEDACEGGVPPRGEVDPLKLGSEVRGDRFRTPATRYAASTIARTWQLFADPGRHVIYPAVTRDGNPAQLAHEEYDTIGEAGALPALLLGAVTVVAIVAFAGAVCYVGQAAFEVIDRKLTQDALTARLVLTQAQAVALLNEHTERDRAAGHPTEWDPAARDVIDRLLDTQREIAGRTGAALPNPFVGAVGGGSKVAMGMGLGVVAVAAAALTYLATRPSTREEER